MNDSPPCIPGATRRLIARELLWSLDQLPVFDGNEQMLATAGADRAQPMPSLSPEQEAIACEHRFVPGPPSAPDRRLLIVPRPRAPAADTLRRSPIGLVGVPYSGRNQGAPMSLPRRCPRALRTSAACPRPSSW